MSLYRLELERNGTRPQLDTIQSNAARVLKIKGGPLAMHLLRSRCNFHPQNAR